MHSGRSIAIVALGLASCGPAAPIEGPAISGLNGCPPLPEVSETISVTRNIVEGPFTNHTHSDWRPGSEIIELRWLPVAPVFLHAMLVYTVKDGGQFVIAGFPEDEFSPVLALGDLVTQVSAFDPEQDRFDEDLSEDSSRLIIAAAEDLSQEWDRMARVANIIEQLGVNYDLVGPNSNSVASTVLKYAGYEPPQPEIFGDVALDVDVIEAAIETGQGRCDAPNVEIDEVIEVE